MKKISIISTSYNEVKNIENCYETIKASFENKDLEYEHIFSDNQSDDGTIEKLKEISKKDKKVKVIINKRNYGPFLNNFNALNFATGDYIIVNFPSDMQDPVITMHEMIKKMENGYDAVFSIKKNSEEKFIIKKIRNLFYFLLKKFGNSKIIQNSNEFICISKDLLKEVINTNDYNPFIRARIQKLSINSGYVSYIRKDREKGRTKNSFFSLYKQAANAFISTMDTAIHSISFISIIISICLLFLLIYTFVTKIFFPNIAPDGLATLVILISFGFSCLLVLLSIILEYLYSINNQVRFNDKVIVNEKINF
jgi:glycosyltransferase involved in cell wall biosynthesis